MYTAGLVYVLYRFGAWTPALAKDTVLWWVAAIGALGSLIASPAEESVLRRIVGGALKLSVVVAFLAGKYTFSLAAEMALTLVVAAASVLGAAAGSDSRHAIVGRTTERLLLTVNLAVLLFVVTSAVSDIHKLATIQTVREVLLVPVLSALLVPFAYLMVWWSACDSIFVCVGSGSTPRSAKIHARWRIVRHLGFGIGRLWQFRREAGLKLFASRASGTPI